MVSRSWDAVVRGAMGVHVCQLFSDSAVSTLTEDAREVTKEVRLDESERCCGEVWTMGWAGRVDEPTLVWRTLCDCAPTAYKATFRAELMSSVSRDGLWFKSRFS